MLVAPCILLTSTTDLYLQTACVSSGAAGTPVRAVQFLPGGGTRRCIGQAFALFTMRIALGMLVGRAELALEEPSGVKPKRRGPSVGPGGGAAHATGRLAAMIDGPGRLALRPDGTRSVLCVGIPAVRHLNPMLRQALELRSSISPVSISRRTTAL